jgi:ABC-type siderophore export system fused ATPase/permease subunit
MLRPSSSILNSSRAARTQHVRAQRLRALAQVTRVVRLVAGNVAGSVIDLFLLGALPLLYAVGAYLTLDLPLRWATGHAKISLPGFMLFVGAALVSLVGILRAVQEAPPVAPVRPRFARAMLVFGWAGALICAIADVAA